VFCIAAILSLVTVRDAGAEGSPQMASYDIRSFGAQGDGRTVNTAAIQAAINQCRDHGGGVVVVPAGTFVSGTLRLFSNIHLQVESGAVLKGSDRISDYSLDGTRLGLIFVQNARDVSITGAGTIDGDADAFFDHTRAQVPGRKSLEWTRQGEHFRAGPPGIGDGPFVALERPKQMVLFSNCRNVTIQDVQITNSPYWALQLIDCDGAVLSNLKVQNSLMMANNNGITVSSSSNIRISGCNVCCGDTAIALFGASHFKNDPGYNHLQHDSENITVTDCVLESRSVGVHVGGWTENSLRHYTFRNIVINDSLRGIKIGVRDRGSVEDMSFSNIAITTRLFRGNWWGNGEPIFIYAYRAEPNIPIGQVRRITFDGVTAEGVSGMLVYGSAESVVEDLTFSNITLVMKSSPLNSVSGGNYDLRPCADPTKQIFSHDIPAFHLEHVRNVRLRNFRIRWDDIPEPYFTNGLDFLDFENIVIDHYTGEGAPHDSNAAAILLENGRGYRILDSHAPRDGARFLETRNAVSD
jgi:polygalacturonase